MADLPWPAETTRSSKPSGIWSEDTSRRSHFLHPVLTERFLFASPRKTKRSSWLKELKSRSAPVASEKLPDKLTLRMPPSSVYVDTITPPTFCKATASSMLFPPVTPKLMMAGSSGNPEHGQPSFGPLPSIKTPIISPSATESRGPRNFERGSPSTTRVQRRQFPGSRRPRSGNVVVPQPGERERRNASDSRLLEGGRGEHTPSVVHLSTSTSVGGVHGDTSCIISGPMVSASIDPVPYPDATKRAVELELTRQVELDLRPTPSTPTALVLAPSPVLSFAPSPSPQLHPAVSGGIYSDLHPLWRDESLLSLTPVVSPKTRFTRDRTRSSGARPPQTYRLGGGEPSPPSKRGELSPPLRRGEVSPFRGPAKNNQGERSPGISIKIYPRGAPHPIKPATSPMIQRNEDVPLFSSEEIEDNSSMNTINLLPAKKERWNRSPHKASTSDPYGDTTTEDFPTPRGDHPDEEEQKPSTCDNPNVYTAHEEKPSGGTLRVTHLRVTHQPTFTVLHHYDVPYGPTNASYNMANAVEEEMTSLTRAGRSTRL